MQFPVKSEIIILAKNVPSKKYLRKLLEFCFINRNNFHCMTQHLASPVFQQFSQDLNLSEQDAHQLLYEFDKLINYFLSLDTSDDEDIGKEIKKLFPDDFDQQFLNLLVESLIFYQEIWKKQLNHSLKSGNQLVDLDWRLDMQLCQTNEEIQRPVVYFQIQSKNQENMKTSFTNFQMNQKELLAVYANLKKIKDQLGQLVGSE